MIPAALHCGKNLSGPGLGRVVDVGLGGAGHSYWTYRAEPSEKANSALTNWMLEGETGCRVELAMKNGLLVLLCRRHTMVSMTNW